MGTPWAPWALWLAAPLVVPILAALVMWWRGRPARPASTPESIAGHREYLQALGAAVGGPDPVGGEPRTPVPAADTAGRE